MKKSILGLSTIIFVFGVLFTSCTDSAQRVEDSKENVLEAEADLQEAQLAYQRDVENHKKNTAVIIRANNESIEDFRARIADEKKELRDEYNEKLAELERKNNDMENKMANYKTDSRDTWEDFKAEFRSDMDQLDKELKELTTSNSRNN